MQKPQAQPTPQKLDTLTLTFGVLFVIKYTDNSKLAVIDHYFNEHSCHQTAQSFHTDHKQAELWVKLYQDISKKKQLLGQCSDREPLWDFKTRDMLSWCGKGSRKLSSTDALKKVI